MLTTVARGGAQQLFHINPDLSTFGKALGNGFAVTLAPMRHWSARWLTDRNKALWAPFIIETPSGRMTQLCATSARFAAMIWLTICAFTVAWERPDQFSKVVSWIGSFTNIAAGRA